MSTPPSHGKTITALRKKLGLTQKEAAMLLGVSLPVLNKIENDKEVNFSSFERVCRGFGIKLALILPKVGEPN